ncbi:DUF2125 domain-containing protein [Bosea sp. (in: a-proteobacteria)]|uniref:DUF2125 domain-containing protein n=1 Tax=Bosea sp. (in: a-proteobacteria) TaxID=1871050 RepID=UPI003B3A054E
MTAPLPPRRRSRFWLYAPFALLALLAAAWSGFWVHVHGRVVAELDKALAREAAQGRTWSCANRSVGGFPFRIELRCDALALTSTRWGDAVRIEAGPAVVVGQVYSPGLVILEAKGPAKATLPEGRTLDVTWKQLDASLAWREPERFALVASEPSLTLTTPGIGTEAWRAQTLELHLRRNPTRAAADQAVDIAVSATGTVLPLVDVLLGTTDPGTIDLTATLTQSQAFRAGFNPDALENWRNANGALDLTRLSAAKGTARIDGSGQLLLDPTHTIGGTLQLSAAGIEQIGGVRIGNLLGGLGGLLGGRPPAASAPGLTPLPPIVLRDGRAFVGPFRLPLKPMQPLY